MLKEILLNFGSILCDLLSMAIFIQVLLSWVVGRGHQVYDFLETLTSPIIKPVKRILPKTGMIDFSPIVALLILEVIKTIWSALISGIL
jgi:YggT family protein